MSVAIPAVEATPMTRRMMSEIEKSSAIGPTGSVSRNPTPPIVRNVQYRASSGSASSTSAV